MREGGTSVDELTKNMFENPVQPVWAVSIPEPSPTPQCPSLWLPSNLLRSSHYW